MKMISNYPKWEQFPDERRNGSTLIEQVHNVQLRMLRIFDTICKVCEVDYWLDYGTLLGAIRHQGFIPWDTDIDIGILRSDYQIFIDKGVKLLPFDMFFQNGDSDIGARRWNHIIEARLRDRFSDWTSIRENPIYNLVDWQNGLQIDFFVYDYYSHDMKVVNQYERYLNGGRIHLQVDEIEFLDTAIFEGNEYSVPVGYNSYLKRCYGNYMKLPSLEEQSIIPNVDIFHSFEHTESLNWKDYYPDN